MIESIREPPRGAGGLVRAARPGGRAHEGGMGGLGSARIPSRTRPPARRFWSLASRFGVFARPLPVASRLKCVRTDPAFGRDGRGRRQDAGRRAHDRAGDREAENPETPPCEGGLSAASTESRSRDPRPPPRAPPTSSTGEPASPKADAAPLSNASGSAPRGRDGSRLG
jgi:hypothetical protein